MIGLGLLVGLVMGGIPSGGFMAEVIICHLMGLPSEYVAMIVIISTIIDMPSTVLNSISNLACVKVINRLIQ